MPISPRFSPILIPSVPIHTSAEPTSIILVLAAKKTSNPNNNETGQYIEYKDGIKIKGLGVEYCSSEQFKEK